MNNTEFIKRLRTVSGAGILDCKNALQETDNNFEKAVEWLKKRGLARAGKKALRETRQGLISSYLHGEGRIGVLVEVNIETDFAARGTDFKDFVHKLCLHIAAMNPLVIDSKEMSEDMKKKEEEVFREQAKREGKSSAVLDKVVEGRMRKWFSEVCLLEQTFLSSTQTDKPQSVKQTLTELIARLGENVVIRRFVRFELGELN